MKTKQLKSVSFLEVVRRAISSVSLLLVVGLVSLGNVQDATTTRIPVDSSAFVFSPGNWVGDAGRGGKLYRQTWNPGAYFRVTWESAANAEPTLLLDTSTYTGPFNAPQLAYCLDGYWGGLHPNPRAHATIAAKIVAQMMAALCTASGG